jgi:hypothetical protein
MNLWGILHILFYLQILRTKEVVAKKCHCQVKVEKTPFTDDLEPAVITPNTYAQLVCALNVCNIERAVVAGWNDHLGVYVLFKNGAVVPGEELTLPNYSLYVRRDAECKLEVFVVANCRFKNLMKCYKIMCSTREVGQARCEIMERSPTNTQECYPSPNVCVESPICKPVEVLECPPVCKPVEPSESKSSESSSESCEMMVRKQIRCKKDPCAITKEKIFTATKFVFEKKHHDYDLLVYQDKLIEKKIKIKASRSNVRLNPRILGCPKILYKALCFAKKRFSGSPCLYISKCSKIYILSDNVLYCAVRNKRGFKFKPLSSKYGDRMRRRGLYLVEFNC